MNTLLKFILDYCARLFDQHGFRIVDSGLGKNAAAGGWMLLESKDAQIHFSYERDQILMQVRSMYDERKRNWYSFDLISKLLGRDTSTGIMDNSNSKFFAENIDEIMQRFMNEESSNTLKKLAEFEAERTARLWK